MKITTQEKMRREKGWTKAELARRSGIQPNVVGWIEAGRFIPYQTQLEKLARALGVEDPSALLVEVEV